MTSQLNDPDGDYLVQRIHANCRDDGGCRIWQGKCTHNGLPTKGNRSLRRIVWEAKHGPLTPKQLVTVACEKSSCLEHLALTDKSEAGKKANEAMHVRLRRSRAVAATRRLTSRLTLDAARAIRASEETCEELASQHGVSASMISKIRLGKTWAETASPFAGLGARA